ncbi:unnamed protein product [Moneuplotes crassus]|uniref:GAR domain-containing protein n=1 Tax=Euplotes crassus TaxID=5936 RepID=A0AAD1XH39_EUPCR|nr:unnamed protein product [Moneuplotes crassus]
MSSIASRSPKKSPKKSKVKSPLSKSKTMKQQTFSTAYYQDVGLTENSVEIDHLKTVIVSLKQKADVADDIQQELDTKTTMLRQCEQARNELQDKYEGLINETDEQAKKTQEYQAKILVRLEFLEKENQMQKSEIQNLKMNFDNTTQIKINIDEELKNSKQHIVELEAQKAELKKQLTIASDYLIEQDDKVHKANKTSLELLDHLKDAELEIETLKDYIVELKHRIAVYIPVESDSVDAKLAEYINNYPERNRLKVMFMRESSGIYQFGTRKIFVKVEQDKIIIRVGGGFLTIDEFLDIYTPLEIEKLERKSPLKKFSEKVAVQKTCIGREIREDSPIRSPARSPKRGSPTGKRSPMRRTSPKKGGSPLKK